MLKKFHLKKGKTPKFAFGLIFALILIIVAFFVLVGIFPSPRTQLTEIFVVGSFALSLIVWSVMLFVLTFKYFLRLHNEILTEVTTDRATGLATFKRLSNVYADLPNKGNGWSLAFIVLNDYDTFLNVFGYNVANSVLNSVGNLLARFTGQNGVAAYLYNGRFLLLFNRETKAEDTIVELKEMLSRLSDIPVKDNDRIFEHHCTTVCNVYFFDGKIGDVDYCTSILKTSLPQSNANCCIDMSEKINRKSRLLTELSNDIENAFANNEFEPFFQAKYSISTGAIVAGELFARWMHPTKGMLMPNDFIPVLESTGRIFDLDVLMVHKACDMIKSCIDKKIPPVPLTLNISKQTILRESYISNLLDIATEHNVPTSLLEISLSQKTVDENVNLIVPIGQRLSYEGFTLVMEHFTLESATITLLRKLNIAVIHLDKKFYGDFDLDEKTVRLLTNTITFLQSLDIMVVGEGVESLEHVDYLKRCGCEYVQGYHFSQPISSTEFFEQISKSDI